MKYVRGIIFYRPYRSSLIDAAKSEQILSMRASEKTRKHPTTLSVSETESGKSIM